MRFHLSQKRTVQREIPGTGKEVYQAINNEDFYDYEAQVLEIFRAVQNLDQFEKKVIYLKFFEELPFTEIAGDMKLDYQKVRRIYKSGMDKLRQKIEL